MYYANAVDKEANKPEQITVGVAHNHDYKMHDLAAMNGNDIMGRSYTSKGYHREKDAKKYGYNFAEQFDYALKIDIGGERRVGLLGGREGGNRRFEHV